MKKDEDYVEPNRPHTTWNLKELKGWLRCNGLSDKGHKSELLVRVSVAKDTISTQPDEVQNNQGAGHISIVINLCKHLSVMFGHVMTKHINKDHIRRTSYSIKQFLSAYNMFDQDLQSLGKHTQNKNNASLHAPTTYGWLTSYNFICLMNLPSVMENYGPITNVWEGGYVGEKFSQELKP